MGKEKKQLIQENNGKINRIQNGFLYLHDVITRLNQSKIFAGIMIIILNIASRFVTIKLSPSMEAYFKYTFSKQLLIFAIAWMGTRDIYIALIITILFSLFMDCLLNEECKMCILPTQFTNYHKQLSKQNEETPSVKTVKQNTNDDKVNDEDIKKAKETLEKAQKQRHNKENSLFPQSVSQLSVM